MLKISAKRARLYAVLWLLIISILFFLPGSALPKESWLDHLYIDKWVHFGFFALLLFLWRYYLPPYTKYHFIILLLALLYGLAVEAIQHYLIINRSFDLGDVLADMVGAIAGVWYWAWYIKKIDPCRNRGRNQN